MKLPPFATAAALLLILPGTLPADWVMENKIENPRATIVATIKAKGDKFRVDVATGPRGAMTTILDTAGGEVIQLSHERKQVSRISSERLKQRIEELKKRTKPVTDAPPPTPKDTGEKEKIGAWECEIYTLESGQSKGRIWIATNLPKAAEINAMLEKLKTGGLGGGQNGIDTSSLPGVIVKAETISPAGKSTMSITALREEDVAATEFNVPDDYTNDSTLTAPAIPPLKTVPSAPSGAPGIEKKGK